MPDPLLGTDCLVHSKKYVVSVTLSVSLKLTYFSNIISLFLFPFLLYLLFLFYIFCIIVQRYWPFFVSSAIEVTGCSCSCSCNAVYASLPKSTTSSLQRVQNAAARLVAGSGPRDHITPVLHSLHWLPVIFRITAAVRRISLKLYN